MCMFSRPVEHVSATRIFARGLDDGRQVLVYSMQLEAREPLAMVLPVPVPPSSPDDAVELVDLAGYPTFFDDLKSAFPESALLARKPNLRSRGRTVTPRPLKVEQVGAYEASFVPSPRDFARLDPRFRLDPDVLARLPQYADWGFVVFQLAKTGRSQVHPMAFRFPRRDPGAIFYPTLHVHDGRVPKRAAFDHQLFGQLPPVVAALTYWDASLVPLGTRIDRDRARGLVDPGAGGHATLVVEEAPNRDHHYAAPRGITLDDLQGRGDCYAYRVCARYHYASASHAGYRHWKSTAAERLPALCRGLRDGLATLVAANRDAWRLAPLVERMRPHFLNRSQLWSGTDARNGSPALTAGRGVVRFTPFTDRVEPQDITLAFAAIPDTEQARRIDRALAAMLDRIVA